MNYIYLLNNLWQNVIHIDGFKHSYTIVYLSIVDSCNRFEWNETPISIDINLAKTKVSKKIFYEAIKWLVDNNLIEYKAGKNEFSMAKYKIVAVQKSTTANTSIDTTGYTTGYTTTTPQLIPNNKHKTNKQINNKQTVFIFDYKNCTEDEFRLEVYKNTTYTKQMLDSFINYWFEKDTKGKSRISKQTTFEIARRLKTWDNNNFGKETKQQIFTPKFTGYISAEENKW